MEYEQASCGSLEPSGHFQECTALSDVDSSTSLTCSCRLSRASSSTSRRLHSAEGLSMDFISYRQSAFQPIDPYFHPLPIQEEEYLSVLSKSSLAVGFVILGTFFASLVSIRFDRVRTGKVKSTSVPKLNLKKKPKFGSLWGTLKSSHRFVRIFFSDQNSLHNRPQYSRSYFQVRRHIMKPHERSHSHIS